MGRSMTMFPTYRSGMRWRRDAARTREEKHGKNTCTSWPQSQYAGNETAGDLWYCHAGTDQRYARARSSAVKQVGLIGYPVSHSLSPQMQQAAFDALGIEARYVLWETQPGTLAQRIASLRSLGVLGANVTIPYKEDVVSLLDEYDAAAVKIGAVNTIVNRDGRLVGYNTNAAGFIRALTDFTGCAFDCHGKKAGILGTGGAARAAAVALLENGVGELALLGRTHGRVEALLNR